VPRTKELIVLLLALCVTLTFLGYFAYQFWRERGNVSRAFGDASWGYVVPAVGLLLLVFVLKGFRWQVIMRPVARPGYWPLFSATAIGFMANCIFPLRVGEVVRAVVLGARHGVRKSTAFATIVVERLFDTLGLLVILCVGLAWVAWFRSGDLRPSPRLRLGAWLFGGMLLAGFAVLVLLRLRPTSAERLVASLTRFLPARWRAGAAGLLHAFIEGLTVIRTVRQAAAVALLSVLHWAMMAGLAHLASLCFLEQGGRLVGGRPVPDFDLGYGGACLVMAVQSFAVALPQLPGFFGTHQTATLEASRMLLADAYAGAALQERLKGIASAYAIVYWCVSILPVVALGLVCLRAEGLSVRAIWRMGRSGHSTGGSEASASRTPAPEG